MKGIPTDAVPRSRLEVGLVRYGSTTAGKRELARELGLGLSTLYDKLRAAGLEQHIRPYRRAGRV